MNSINNNLNRIAGVSPSRSKNTLTSLEDRCIKLRSSGKKVADVAAILGCSISMVSQYTKHLNVSRVNTETASKKILELNKKGYRISDIAKSVGVSVPSVYKCLSRNGAKVNNRAPKVKIQENKQICICLIMDGYSVNQVSDITGLKESSVRRHTVGVSMIGYCKSTEEKVKRKAKEKLMSKKKVMAKKAKPSAIEMRSQLGKGIQKGVIPTEIKMREDRDEGTLVTFSYKGYGADRILSIRNRDGSTSEEAAIRWCIKNGKEFVRCV